MVLSINREKNELTALDVWSHSEVKMFGTVKYVIVWTLENTTHYALIRDGEQHELEKTAIFTT